MLSLKLIAPFRALFTLDSALVTAHPAEFDAFLGDLENSVASSVSPLARRMPEGVQVQVRRKAPRQEALLSRYVSLDRSGSFHVSPCLLTLTFSAARREALTSALRSAAQKAHQGCAFSQAWHVDPETLSIGIYDDTIAILECRLSRDDTLVQDHSEEGDWGELDGWTTRFMRHLLESLYPHDIYPVLKAIGEFCHAGRHKPFILETGRYRLFCEMAMAAQSLPEPEATLLWVSRTLLCRGEPPLNGWTRPALRSSGTIALPQATLHLNWGNNIVVMAPEAEAGTLDVFWTNMLAAQYYYAALDAVSADLSKYVGLRFAPRSSQTVKHLYEEIESVIHAVTFLQLRYQEFGRELQGLPRIIFLHLQHEWRFGDLAGDVQMKVDLCKSHLAALVHDKLDRDQGREEIALTALAGMGMFNLMISLSNYAAQAHEAKKNQAFETGMTLTQDMMSAICLALGMIIISLILKNRTDRI